MSTINKAIIILFVVSLNNDHGDSEIFAQTPAKDVALVREHPFGDFMYLLKKLFF